MHNQDVSQTGLARSTGMTEVKLPQPMQCDECQAGMMQVRYITYFTWLGEELITVPNFPAWVCDVCGRRKYDERAISWLSMLLSPNTGKSTTRVHRHRPVPPKADTSYPRPE
jgi:YgiT-type zinc finger domain-containing protein